MSFRIPVAVIGTLVAGALLLTGTAMAQDPAPAEPTKVKALKQVRTWAYVGPRGYLANARITLKDRTGKTIGTGKTNERGTYTFNLQSRKTIKLPLLVTTSGGRITAALPTGKVLSKPFKGHLSARVFDATTRSPVVQLGLISTAVTEMATTRKQTEQATRLVWRALGMGDSAPADILRLRNSYVGFNKLMVAVQRAGGFDHFASNVAKLALAKKKVGKLRPASANSSGAIPARLIRGKGLPRQARQGSMPASSTICQVGVPDDGSTSDEVITDVSEVGIGALMKVAGLPTTATNSITGMVLGQVGVSGTSVQDANAAAVNADLDCLGEQVNYLSQQISHLQFTMDVAAANTCADALDDPSGWQAYNYLLSNPQYLYYGEPSLTVTYMPFWKSASIDTCGASIANALWGTKSQDSAWQQLVSNTIGTSKWYSQSQNQQLQTFLSYWGMMTYQQFVLRSEWSNYNNQMVAIQQASGGTTNSAGEAVCVAGTTVSTQSFCVYRSNIMQAYPPDLYSDEVGIVNSGLAVSAIPTGVFSPAPILDNPGSGMASTQSKFRATQSGAQGSYSAKAGNPAWFWNYYLNFTPYSGGNSGNYLWLQNWGQGMKCVIKVLNNCPGPQTNSQTKNFAWDAAGYFNGKGINPKGYGTAVQTFDNPQATPKYPNNASGGALVCGDVSDLKSNNTTGISGVQALFNGVNQAPNGGDGPWNGLSVNDTGYYVNAWDSYSLARLTGTTALVGWHTCLGSYNPDGGVYGITSIPTKPVFATLLTRVWWSAVSKAPTFTPQAPKTA